MPASSQKTLNLTVHRVLAFSLVVFIRKHPMRKSCRYLTCIGMYGHSCSKSYDQLGKVANPTRGQLSVRKPPLGWKKIARPGGGGGGGNKKVPSELFDTCMCISKHM